MKIWIVLPAYYEEKALPQLIDALVEQLTEENRNFETLIVNDGSQDRKNGKVPLKGVIHLGAVKHGLTLFLVGHLLLREGGTEDILG